MLKDYWKIPDKVVEKAAVRDFAGSRPLKKIVSVEIRNEEILPRWADRKFKLFLKEYSPVKKSSDCIIKLPEADISLMDLSDGVYLNNFDSIINSLLSEDYIKSKRPAFSRLPVPYTKIPPKIRVGLFNLLNRFKKDPGFPNWPTEKSVETLRHLFINALKIKSDKPIPYISLWPENKGLSVVLTHDCDSESSFKTMDNFREIERRFGFKSSWNFVPKKYAIHFGKLRELKKEGCEIGIHGYDHTGSLPYLEKGEIIRRVEYSINKFSEFNVRGFRSSLLQRTPEFLALLSKYFEYDSSKPDTDIYSPVAYRNGSCTVFPFFINNMAELPITMPQDWRLIRMNLKPGEIIDIWKRKIDFIRQVNGMVLLNVHPDDFISGNEKYLKVYENILGYLYKIEDKWSALPFEVGEWWKSRRGSFIKDNRVLGAKKAVLCEIK